jgi:hypothetical protein
MNLVHNGNSVNRRVKFFDDVAGMKTYIPSGVLAIVDEVIE